MVGEMSDLWPRIEPLLARVEKPARYIGMERGSRRPTWAPQVAFLLIYPDTYEIGLPNQGLQILYEILNERADAVAERAYAPWTDMESSCARRASRSSASTPTVRPRDFDVLAFNLSAELVYTNLLNLVDLAGVARAQRRTVGPSDPIVIAGGHCAYNPEPLAEYVDAFVIGDGEEAVGEIAEVVARAGSAAGNAPPRSRAARARDDPRRVRARRCTTSSTTARSSARSRRASPTCPRVVDKRTVADLAEWPYPKQQLVPLVEVVHDRLNVEIFRGCTRGCRFCQAGMITRPCASAATSRCARWSATACAGRATTKSRSRRCRAPTSPASTASSPTSSNDQEWHRQRCVSLPSLRVDAFSVGIATEIQKVRRTGLTFAPEAGSWRLRQVINKLIARRRSLRRGRRRVLAGLAAGEAVLPHRPAHRDGRRHDGDRASSPATSSRSGASTRSRPVARCRWAGSCRSRTRRSSGSARTASTSSSARSPCLRDDLTPRGGTKRPGAA